VFGGEVGGVFEVGDHRAHLLSVACCSLAKRHMSIR
jgi:hypothetical protein